MTDLHKEIEKRVRNRSDRERAQASLRKLYEDAAKGSEWEGLATEPEAKADLIDPNDPIEFYEVEMRGVAVVWPEEGMGYAWVWQDGSGEWNPAPGLVNKSWLEGTQYNRQRFQCEFAKADLVKLVALASALPNIGRIA